MLDGSRLYFSFGLFFYAYPYKVSEKWKTSSEDSFYFSSRYICRPIHPGMTEKEENKPI